MTTCVEVFRTNVAEMYQAEELLVALSYRLPHCRINFDMDDCDKILRVEGMNVSAGFIISLLNDHGFECDALE